MWVFGILTNVVRISQATVLRGQYMNEDSMLPGPVITDNRPFMV